MSRRRRTEIDDIRDELYDYEDEEEESGVGKMLVCAIIGGLAVYAGSRLLQKRNADPDIVEDYPVSTWNN